MKKLKYLLVNDSGVSKLIKNCMTKYASGFRMGIDKWQTGVIIKFR